MDQGLRYGVSIDVVARVVIAKFVSFRGRHRTNFAI
jgi:hypothetical protein